MVGSWSKAEEEEEVFLRAEYLDIPPKKFPPSPFGIEEQTLLNETCLVQNFASLFVLCIGSIKLLFDLKFSR